MSLQILIRDLLPLPLPLPLRRRSTQFLLQQQAPTMASHLDIFLLNQCPHSVLELPRQCEATLRAALDDGQAQVAELVLALHVVLAGQPRVLRRAVHNATSTTTAAATAVKAQAVSGRAHMQASTEAEAVTASQSTRLRLQSRFPQSSQQ